VVDATRQSNCRLTPEVVSGLLLRLQYTDSDVRYEAAAALGNLGQGTLEVVSGLLSRLQDAAPIVRSGAAEALGNLGQKSDEVLPTLVQWLEQQSTEEAKDLGRAVNVLWQIVTSENS
jgi:HEAT repeat protein